MHPLFTLIMETMLKDNASDVYITASRHPFMRKDDVMKPLKDFQILTNALINDMIKGLLNEKQYQDFQHMHEMNVSFGISDMGRFRVNILQQRQSSSMVIRAIKRDIPKFETLGLPESLKKIVLNKRGIVLMCGMTGSGKSTTLASLIDYRNEVTSGHIITIEDPIEYLYEHKMSLVSQREVGVDTDSYHVALKNAFRQKPDVILIGEIRDRYVMEQALIAAETGHLCMSTIHANNAYQAIERILNFFDEAQLQQVRTNLAANLRAIVAQRLVTTKEGSRTLAYEIMLNEGYIRDLILKGETGKIRDVMAQNRSKGMATFDQVLMELYDGGIIDAEVAIAEADMPVDMELKIRKDMVSGSFTANMR
jgi:twitching motility protein PilU